MTVYRLITSGTIEERVQQRARRKHAIQKAVIEAETDPVYLEEGNFDETTQSFPIKDEEESFADNTPIDELAEMLLMSEN